MTSVHRSYRCIPIFDARKNWPLATAQPIISAPPLPWPAHRSANGGAPVLDTLGRPLHDLRISVTDQCNFRCRYCMPREEFGHDHTFLPHRDLMSFDEISTLAKAAIALGVHKIRLTGGEPLLRKNLEQLVAQLASLHSNVDLTLTTNGSLLERKASALKAAGLSRITVSLDAMDERVFQRMNDMDVPVAKVLAGIDAALHAGFERIKVNVVVRRGWNEDQILPLARHFMGMPITLRFIEFMDVGKSKHWSLAHVVPSAEVLQILQTEFELARLPATRVGETAQRWSSASPGLADEVPAGEIGLISSVTAPFCGDCNRARVTADGKLFTCLFAPGGVDLMPVLRPATSDTLRHVGSVLQRSWGSRHDRYSETRATTPLTSQKPKENMNYMGG